MKGVVFDIGGVLERDCDRGLGAQYLGIQPDELSQRLSSLWRAGALGQVSLDEVEQALAREFSLSRSALQELMEQIWTDYLGQLNRELLDYLVSLRPSHRTAILSNSFVGAREREQPYGFAQCVPSHLLPRSRDLQAGPAHFSPDPATTRPPSGSNPTG